MSAQLLQCPICNGFLDVGATNADLNRHVDECLNMSFIEKEEPAAPPLQPGAPPQPVPVREQPIPFASLPPARPSHNPPPPAFPSLPNRCEICGKGFQTFSQLFSHKGQEHPSNPGLLKPDPPPAEPPQSLRNSEDFECPCCGQSFSNYEDFSIHMTTTSCKDLLYKSIEDPEPEDLSVSLPQELTGEYHSFSLNMSMTGECGICFEDFEKGQTVARLDCLCVYHKECIASWYKKSGEKRCPIHGEDFTNAKW